MPRKRETDAETDAILIAILSRIGRLAGGLFRIATIWIPDPGVREAAQEDAREIERSANRGRRKLIEKQNRRK